MPAPTQMVSLAADANKLPRAMWFAYAVLCAGILVASFPVLWARKLDSAAKSSQNNSSTKAAEPEAELQKALADAGNDSTAMVRNLKNYLQKFPDAPRKAAVYRALVEACQQIRDNACALDYAERLVAVHPDDSQIMLLAVELLEERGDGASLTRAGGYATRVLDRVEKMQPDERPARESVAEWQTSQQQLRSALYYVRGHVENSQKNYESAVKDLQASYFTCPNALAAKLLGEIAEMRKDLDTAMEEYALAFALPEIGPAGTVNRREVRRQLGNVWRQVNGSEQGLGDAILVAYDKVASQQLVAQSDASVQNRARNKSAKEFSAFVERRLDGSPIPLATLKGKVVVLSFWATWCEPCRELEPMFDQVARNYSGNPDVSFLAVNTDDDEPRVAPFVTRERWDVPVIFADGLDDFMKVETLPTVLVLGRNGEIVYRTGGLVPDGFPGTLTAAIQTALDANP
jgi:thiol-disulfide isomerase/thioredoxin